MAIVSPSDFLSSDGRWRRWGKLVQGFHHIDLSKQKGFALTGPFVKWNESVALGVQQFLVVASETGSRRSHDYDYALVEGGESPRQVTDEERKQAFRMAKSERKVPETQEAAARNSVLYEYALYCFIVLSRPAVCEEERQAPSRLITLEETA